MKARKNKGQNRLGLARKEFSSGVSGHCVCMKCGYTSVKKRGVPCMEEKCPECGAVLLKKGGYHYQKAIKKSQPKDP